MKFYDIVYQKRYLLLLLLLYLAAEFLIHPFGNFPLNDDWAYGKAVQALVSYGHVHFCDWQATTFITQWLWGSLFCLLGGFSFTVLRISTIVLSCLGIVFFYLLVEDFTQKPLIAFLSGLILFFNPICLQLSNTFMPDIPFMVFSIILFWVYGQYIKKEQSIFYILGLVFLVLTLLVRQTAVAFPLACAIVWVYLKGANKRSLMIGLFPLLLAVLTLASFHFILGQRYLLPASYDYQLHELVYRVFHPGWLTIKRIIYYTLTASISLGIFLIPLTFVYVFKRGFFRPKRFIHTALLTLYFFAVIMRVILTGKFIPFVGNIIYRGGLGPIILHDTISYHLSVISMIGKICWMAVALAGAFSMYVFLASLVTYFIKAFQQKVYDSRFYIVLFSTLLCLIYFLPFSLIYVSDRYLVFMLPFLILLFWSILSDETRKLFNYRLAFFILLPFVVLSVFAVYDYLAFNRVKWQALNELTQEKKVAPKQIDGGFEFNAWYLFDFNNYHSENRRWWWVEGDQYIVDIHPVKGYHVLKKYPVRNYLPPKQSIWVLEKN